jgi:hypothetical protein
VARRWVAVAIGIVATIAVTGCSSSSDDVGSTAPASTVPETTTAVAASDSYETSGTDIGAICAQLQIIADHWDGPVETYTPTADGLKAALVRHLAELTAASDRVQELAPRGLAHDVGDQVRMAHLMLSVQLPSEIDPPTDASRTGLATAGAEQDRLNAFTTANCGFAIWVDD